MTMKRLRRFFLAAFLVGVAAGLAWVYQTEGRWESRLSAMFPKEPEHLTARMVVKVAISDDGRLVAKLTAPDDRVTLVDLVNRRDIGHRAGNSFVPGLALDSRGLFLAYALDVRSFVVEDLGAGTRRVLPDPSGKGISAIAMAAGGYPLLFATCGDGVFVIRGPMGSSEVVRSATENCRTQWDMVYSCAIDHANGLFAIGRSAIQAPPHDRSQVLPDRKGQVTRWLEPFPGPLGTAVFDLGTLKQVASIVNVEFTDVDFDGLGHVVTTDPHNFGVSVWKISDGRLLWAAPRSWWGAGASQFLSRGRLLVSIRQELDDGEVEVFETGLWSKTASYGLGPRIHTAGHFAAKYSDKFLVAHRSGLVDVYRVSADGRKIEKYWEF